MAMRTFVSVVQKGGFSGAARVMGAPKTRISQRVQDLEAALNVRLLQRTTRRVTPTEEGLIYFDKCLQIIEDIEAADRAMHRSGERPEGRLHVTVMSSVAHAVILPRLQDFLATFPFVSLKLLITDRLTNLVEDGIDCAIRGGDMESSSLISRHVCDVPFGLFATPDYLKRGKPIVLATDLQSVDRLVVNKHQTGTVPPWRLYGPEGVLEVDTPPRLECDDDQALLTACINGSGVALFPRPIVSARVRSGELMQVLPEWSGESRPVYIVYPSRRYQAAKLRCFIDWAKELLKAELSEDDVH